MGRSSPHVRAHTALTYRSDTQTQTHMHVSDPCPPPEVLKAPNYTALSWTDELLAAEDSIT